MIDHVQAVETLACERYLLGEMGQRERAEYEEHFFECRECGEAVRLEAAFIVSLRAYWKALPVPGSWLYRLVLRWWRFCEWRCRRPGVRCVRLRRLAVRCAGCGGLLEEAHLPATVRGFYCAACCPDCGRRVNGGRR